jgi:hypothetical protein
MGTGWEKQVASPSSGQIARNLRISHLPRKRILLTQKERNYD